MRSEAPSTLRPVSEPLQPDTPQDPQASVAEEAQTGALPVLAGGTRLVRAQPLPRALPEERRGAGAMLPAVQAAAVAAGGFLAGAAVVRLVHRRQRRSAALAGVRRRGRDRRAQRRGRQSARAGELVQIVGSRSLLLDVHLLGGAGDR